MSAPATPALCRQIAFFALGPLLCFLLKDLPPLEGMNPDGMVCLAGCVWLMLWWMTEVLPLPVTSLMAVPIFGFLGVMAPDKVFATIGHPAMMLIFGATIIVGVWKESNLIERYAYWCFNLPFVRGNPVRMVLIFTFGAGVMSAIAPNIPLTILFISIAVAIGKSCNLAPDNNMMRSLCTLSAIAPALGGVGTPLGGAPNIVVIAIVATVLSSPYSPVSPSRRSCSPWARPGKASPCRKATSRRSLRPLARSRPTNTPPSGSWWSRWCSGAPGRRFFPRSGWKRKRG